ncbi:hypothetical protein OIU84_010155 [Salix udensis]|uniref:Uncharacterized protein n=1 Tax=Salix udensis TaxID=889485 RepID=A0AAD6NVJ6_9ROSI|nr:hypothetical protein OIU84_010155 [Salix udensis]
MHDCSQQGQFAMANQNRYLRSFACQERCNGLIVFLIFSLCFW